MLLNEFFGSHTFKTSSDKHDEDAKMQEADLVAEIFEYIGQNE